MLTLNFYYRHGCHLCDEMLAMISSYQASIPMQIQMHDIDANPELKQQYSLLIPVLNNENDEEICHHFFDKAGFEQFLAQSRSK